MYCIGFMALGLDETNRGFRRHEGNGQATYPIVEGIVMLVHGDLCDVQMTHSGSRRWWPTHQLQPREAGPPTAEDLELRRTNA